MFFKYQSLKEIPNVWPSGARIPSVLPQFRAFCPSSARLATRGGYAEIRSSRPVNFTEPRRRSEAETEGRSEIYRSWAENRSYPERCAKRAELGAKRTELGAKRSEYGRSGCQTFGISSDLFFGPNSIRLEARPIPYVWQDYHQNPLIKGPNLGLNEWN